MTASQEPTAQGMAVRTAVILFLFVIAFTATLSMAYMATKPDIEAAAMQARMRTIDEVLPKELYDNDLLADTLTIPPSPELGLDEDSTVYRARRAGTPAAVVLEAVAPDGYSGKIRMLVAVQADGRLAGVRVTQHKETPGLGDYVEPKKDKNKARPWITQFDGLSLETALSPEWKVKKDGGRFDSVAGATVTPRAVVKAVHKALQYANKNRDRLFASQQG